MGQQQHITHNTTRGGLIKTVNSITTNKASRVDKCGNVFSLDTKYFTFY